MLPVCLCAACVHAFAAPSRNKKPGDAIRNHIKKGKTHMGRHDASAAVLKKSNNCAAGLAVQSKKEKNAMMKRLMMILAMVSLAACSLCCLSYNPIIPILTMLSVV